MASPQTQKRIFQIVSILFVLLMIYFTYDFLSKTTRPGGRGQLKERIQNRLDNDTLSTDSVSR